MDSLEPVIESLNKDGRLRAIYYRPVKNKEGETIDWMATMPLPADVQGQAQYLGRGFKLADPRIQRNETAVVDAAKAKITEELMAENKRLKEQLEAAKAKDVAVPATAEVVTQPATTPAQDRMAKVRAARGQNKVT